LDFSKDGEWVAYTDMDGLLWRSRRDGRDRLQLTFVPSEVLSVRWSPDGKRIGYAAHSPGKPLKIFLVPAEGGAGEELIPEDREQADPQWSTDGSLLLFVQIRPDPECLHIFDLKTRHTEALAGSAGLRFPRWSPDGRYIAALDVQDRKVVLFDYSTHKRTELARLKGLFCDHSWSRDGQCLYILGDISGEGLAVLRYRISDFTWEQIVSPEEHNRLGESDVNFLGLAPDDPPVLIRTVNYGNIYALDWEAP
jgi:Tol biopolymer transport system component